MNKAHQHIPDMFEAARKCASANILVTYNLIFGFPGENDSHRKETLRVMGQIAERYPNVSFSPNLFTPYPGIPIWPELCERGLQEPASLQEWSAMGLGGIDLPWLSNKSSTALHRGMSFFLLDSQLSKNFRKANSPAVRSLINLLRKPLHWRLRYYFFHLPLELWLSMAKEWLQIRRSLLTGDPLSRRLAQSR